MDLISYILSRKYVDNSISGISGVLAGKNCTIYSSTKSGDTTTIVFKWTADDGTEKTTEIQVEDGETPTITSTEIEGGHTITFTTTDPSQSVSFNVMDGLEGQRGVSVIRADVDNNNYLKLELSDGNIINAGQIKTVSMVDNTLSLESANPVENRVITSALNNKVNKVSGKQLSTEDFTTAEKNKLANIENGAQVNTLENLIINGEEATIVDKKIALNIITSAVSNLQNYYLKSETYTKQEVEELIGSTVGVTIEIVQALPTVGQTNVIYFLPTETANVYSQYIYTSADGWVLIGSTSVDLSNYYTKGQVDTLLNGKQNVLTIDAFPTAMSNNPVASGGVYSAIAQMQPQFQFTNMPVASESNYGFVYQYVGNAGTYEPNMFYRCVYNTYAGEYRWEEVIFHATVTVDSELSSTSTNPVQNKVVKEALDAKQDIMQFSTMPSAQDNLGKIVQYTGATTATYQNACFYKAVYDSEHDTYVWTRIDVQPNNGGGGSSLNNIIDSPTLGNIGGIVENSTTDREYTYESQTLHVKPNKATGDFSHAEGLSVEMEEEGTTIGAYTTSSGMASHAEGIATIASGEASHSEGQFTIASGKHSHAEGSYTTASGDYSHSEGNGTRATYESAHAEGNATQAKHNYTHTEGDSTVASRPCAHAEGSHTTASGFNSHAEGYNTTASGNQSHAEGGTTTASGSNAHAEGNSTVASGNNSHTSGYATKAGYECQTVIGKYNNNKSTTYFEVGNGTANNDTKNIFEVYNNGAISQDDGNTQFKFSAMDGKKGYYDNLGDFYGLIDIPTLQSVVANSSNYTNFQTNIAKLSTYDFVWRFGVFADSETGALVQQTGINLSHSSILSKEQNAASISNSDTGAIKGYLFAVPQNATKVLVHVSPRESVEYVAKIIGFDDSLIKVEESEWESHILYTLNNDTAFVGINVDNSTHTSISTTLVGHTQGWYVTFI